MTKTGNVILIVSFCLLPFSGFLGWSLGCDCHAGDQDPPEAARQQALDQRGRKVLDENDRLIQRTVEAYGGSYSRDGKTKKLVFNQKTYRDFSIEVVASEYIYLETPDGTFRLKVVEE
jgi:hypothetical protein